MDSRLAGGESDADLLSLDDPKAKAKQREQEVAQEAARKAAAYYARINPLMVEGLRKVKKSVEGIGLEYYVFPVDEPCGTPWRRAWTKYVSSLAHEAGLKVWSTHNDVLGWDSGIDISCPGWRIASFYAPVTIERGKWEGELAFPAIPVIGRMRDGVDRLQRLD